MKPTTTNNNPSNTVLTTWSGGWRAVLGCNENSLALFRISIGILLLFELVLRFRFIHPFYSDEGTFPINLLHEKIDTAYKIICIHAYSGTMLYQQALLTVQVLFALSFTVGYRTRVSSIMSWYLYLSLTLRNTWLNFILDRYFHYMLFYSMFLPIGNVISMDAQLSKKDNNTIIGDGGTAKSSTSTTIVSLATIALKAQVFWIYFDAGQGKYNDPLGGWTYHADPLPALDTYARHTSVARYMYAILTPAGLRFMTPTVVYVELLAAPITLFASYMGNANLALGTIATICSLHVGIALTVRNTVLLSLVACAAWCVFLPPPPVAVTTTTTMDNQNSHHSPGKKNDDYRNNNNAAAAATNKRNPTSTTTILMSTIFIIPLICGSIWFETMSNECNQSMKHIWSVLLHNRWNVFVGAEEYVTWEIAPGKLADGSVVDVWGNGDYVNWNMPGTGAPCTSTARPGRWRSFPYLAELDGEDGYALWSYLCRQWDQENGVGIGSNENLGRKLLRYNFFMLQADVLPNMGFSATRKRLIHSHDCTAKWDASRSGSSSDADSGDDHLYHKEGENQPEL